MTLLVWGGGWLGAMGVLDFAGGTVVHINAGVAALVVCMVLGKRHGYPTTQMVPNSLVLTLVGASMLWVGWFGFNADSELAAAGVAGMAMAVTHIATATAALTWMGIEWCKHGKPSVLGIATGAVAGLVAITPASGTVGPIGAIGIGFASGALCFYAASSLKRALGYDDSLDVFGVHGVAGAWGALATGLFVWEHGAAGDAIWTEQIVKQLISVGFVAVFVTVATLAILFVLKMILGDLRIDDEGEDQGLDLALHSETAYASTLTEHAA